MSSFDPHDPNFSLQAFADALLAGHQEDLINVTATAMITLAPTIKATKLTGDQIDKIGKAVFDLASHKLLEKHAKKNIKSIPADSDLEPRDWTPTSEEEEENRVQERIINRTILNDFSDNVTLAESRLKDVLEATTQITINVAFERMLTRINTSLNASLRITAEQTR